MCCQLFVYNYKGCLGNVCFVASDFEVCFNFHKLSVFSDPPVELVSFSFICGEGLEGVVASCPGGLFSKPPVR